MKTPLPKMRDFCEITSSKRIFASEYVSSGVPFYRSKEIIERQSGRLEVSTEIFITESRFEDIESKFGSPQEGDLLLTSVGTLGIPYVVNKDERFYFKDGNLTWFRKFNSLNSRYLYYWFLSPIGKAELKKATIGSSQSAYTINLLNDLTIDPPDIDFQLRVVSLLSTYDDLIETNRRRIALLEESARLLYREWFVNLRFPEHELVKWQDNLPEGWRKCYLKDIATLNYGKALKESDRIAGQIPVYGSSGIVGAHNTSLIDGPAIIVGRKGNVGSVFFSDIPCYAIDTVYFVSGSDVNYYLFQLLQTLNFISSDSAVPGLNRNYAYGLEILRPDASTLEAFEATIAPVFQQISTLKSQNTVLKNARDELLPKLMSGTIQI
jgi:type I restriction enzyme S subunit